jgi:low affinity Fe/Cu permease
MGINTIKGKKRAGSSGFEKFASAVCKATGSTPAFIGAFSVVVIWAISGPFFDFSETWQLVINTGTTIITFLMVFLIQKAQNKDSLAIQLKLNELVASSDLSSNRLVDIESMTEEEMEVIKKYYHKLSVLTKNEESLNMSHSIEEAEKDHHRKQKKTGLESTKKPAKQKTFKNPEG